MIFSFYPTDSYEVIDEIVQMVVSYGEKTVFTSLHMKESENLNKYLNKLKNLNEEKQIVFFADISPNTLKMLSISIEEIGLLKTYGIIGLRIDFGFDIEDIIKISKLGFEIAINASVVDSKFIDKLKGVPLIAWHNFYPRPETAINIKFLNSQNEMFEKYNIPIYTFIPGEKYLRAPLFYGLPTIESQRFLNCYLNYLEMKRLNPNMKIVLAEGVCFEKHIQWILKYEKENIITIPLTSVDDKTFHILSSKIFVIRKEETDYSWRLEETRFLIPSPVEIINATKRFKGSIQMDTKGYGRYEGELHIMKDDFVLDQNVIRIAEIPSSYINLVDSLTGCIKISFVRE